jgi:hypothetical protein
MYRMPSMVRAGHVLILSAFCGVTFSEAIHTWGGLNFGMTEAQVRSVLGSKMINAGANQSEVFDRLFMGATARESGVEGFDGHASLFFGKADKRLARINLMLDPNSSTDSEKISAYRGLRDNLLKKYGTPVSTSGYADDAPESFAADDCNMIFRTGGQTVTVWITHRGVPGFAVIVYEPLPRQNPMGFSVMHEKYGKNDQNN